MSGPLLRVLSRVPLLVALALAVPAKVQPESLRVESPPGLAGVAAQLEALASEDLPAFEALLGIVGPGEPIRAVLVGEGSDVARATPSWIAGFARGEDNLIVLFPRRIPSYPYSSLTELVRHERAHVMIDRAANGESVPRWFHEGLAMIAEGGWRVSDRSRLAMAMLRSGEPELGDLDLLFGGGEQQVAWAYAVSGAFVRDIVRRGEEGSVARLFEDVRAGVAFETAFRSRLGSTPAVALERFWGRTALWYRWLPVMTSSTVLWIGISLLALFAIKRRQMKDRKMLERWEAEERLGEQENLDVVN